MNEKTTTFELMEPASPEALVPQSGLWPWLVVAAIAVLLAVILILFLRKRSGKPPDAATLRLAAYLEAVAGLACATTADARNAAVQCSLILRKYLSNAAGDPALFETHDEFVARHDALKALTAEARSATEAGFTRLAALKYAPELPAAVPAVIIAESRALLETLHHGFAA